MPINLLWSKSLIENNKFYTKNAWRIEKPCDWKTSRIFDLGDKNREKIKKL